MRNNKAVYPVLVLAACFSVGILAALQGCTTNVPSLAFYPPAPTPTPSGCAFVLFNGAESLTENGTWTGTNSVRGLSPLNATEGTWSLDVSISSAIGWNDNILLLGGFVPNVWGSYSQLLADVYVEPSVVAGATYSQFLLFADSSAASAYYDQISSSTPNLVAGMQTITWVLDFPIDADTNILSTDPMTSIRFIYNNSASPGTGHIYLDKIRFCP